jgi:hypothetical protein
MVSMNFKNIIPHIVTASLLLGSFLLLFFWKNHSNNRPEINNLLSSQGIEEDRGGRRAYENERHRNPVTGLVPANARLDEMKMIQRNFLKKLSEGRSSRKDQMQETLPAWKCIGPNNLGGRTRALAIDRGDPTEKTILAGCVSGGMWRSENGGQTWVKTSAAEQLQSVSCIAQDIRAGHRNTWYYGTGEMFDASDPENDNGLVRGNGIFKSVDGGRSWQVLPSTVSGKEHLYDNAFDYVWDVEVDVSNANEDEVYAATINGIFRSVDGGTVWQKVLASTSDGGRYTDLVITSKGVVFATISNINGMAMQSGVFRSADGITWQNLTPPWWPRRFNRVVMAVPPSNENKMYVLADLSTVNRKSHLLCIYEQSRGWRNISANLPDYEYDIGDYDSQLSFNMVMAAKPDDENTIFLGGINLYRSTDGFETQENTQWIGGYDPRKTDLSKYPHQHPDQHAIVFFKDPMKMMVGHDGGVSLLGNNKEEVAQWKSISAGYVTTQFYTAAINQAASDGIVIGGMQDNGSYFGLHDRPANEWASLLSGDGSSCAVSNNGNRYYVSSQYGRIYRMDYDRGEYKGFARIDPPEPLNYLFINPFVLDTYNSNILYMAGGECIWRNDNASRVPGGSNETSSAYWKKLDGACSKGGNITALAVSSVPGNVLYYGTSRGRLFKLNNSNEATGPAIDITGQSFPNYFGRQIGYISSISVDPFDAERIMVSFSNYEVMSIFFSDDGGASWSAVAGNLETQSNGGGAGPAVYSCAMLHRQNSTLYLVGTSAGLFYTDQLAGMQTSWTWEKSIGNVPVETIVCRQKDGLVLAATHGYGIHTTRFTDATDPKLEPLVFSVGQNYPNPVSNGNSTFIPLRMDEDRYMDLKLYDATGRTIKSIFEGEIKAGDHLIEFNAGSLAPGTYFYGLKGYNSTVTKRMIVW